MSCKRDLFRCIRFIDPMRPDSWRDRLFITVDIDWATDEILAYTVELLERMDLAATFFVTHDTVLLRDIRANPRFELGIHPNFNNLLFGRSQPASAADAESIVRRLLDVVPEARSVRSHSMTQSSRLLDLFASLGLSHDCNHFVPSYTGISLTPYRHWNGIVKVPYFWEDDVALLYREAMRCDMSISTAASKDGLRVFNFHPIHIALNTPAMSHYENTRAVHRDWNALRAMRHAGYGVECMLKELVETLGH